MKLNALFFKGILKSDWLFKTSYKSMTVKNTVTGAVWCRDLCSDFNPHRFWTTVDVSTVKRQNMSLCCYENSFDLTDHLTGFADHPGTHRAHFETTASFS